MNSYFGYLADYLNSMIEYDLISVSFQHNFRQNFWTFI